MCDVNMYLRRKGTEAKKWISIKLVLDLDSNPDEQIANYVAVNLVNYELIESVYSKI
jgi:hypothetical protein